MNNCSMISIGVFQSLHKCFLPLRSSQCFHITSHCSEAYRTLIGYSNTFSIRFTAFRSNQDYTIRTSCTINSCRRSILQNFYVSMSFGLSKWKSSITTPSTTYNGSVEALIVFTPRISTRIPAPG